MNKKKPGLRYAALSDAGLRAQNEDAYCAGRAAGYNIFAVADGLGGHARGEIASRMAVRIFEETAVEYLTKEEPSGVIRRAFEDANAAICAYNRENALNAATTLSAAIVTPSGRCWIGTVGDSRTYIVTPDAVWHTRDQTYVQDLVESGVISAAEAMLHPRRNVLTRALGLSIGVQIVLDQVELAGGVLLISSDGLHDYAPESTIREIVLADEPAMVCRRLIEAAMDAASTDNITVIVARA
ncbi:MAG: protein phosphatase 2C domain-containing protein [Methanoculleus sp.]